MEVMIMSVSSSLQGGKTDLFEETRQTQREAFLKREGLAEAGYTPLPVDASQRRYFRLPDALLMDAPPPDENTAQFQRIAELLQDTGLSVPHIYAADHAYGFLLIEDWGDLSYRNAFEQGYSERVLYEETIRALSHLHQKMPDNKMERARIVSS